MSYNNIKKTTLNYFQKKKIKERLSLDFFKELDEITDNKTRFSKTFSQHIELLVNKFDNNGIIFYGINIELPFSKEKSDFWECIYTDMEEFINYIGDNIELIEFCYFGLEIKGRNNDNKMIPYIRGIIGVRSLVGKNKLLFFELRNIFSFYSYNIDFRCLSKCSEAIKYWNLIIKEKNFKFHRFVNYSDFYSAIYGDIADEELKFDGRYAFCQENHFISNTMNISGIKKKLPNKKELILYFLNLFMFKNNLVIFNNIIFIKTIESKFSWQKFYNLDEMKKNFNNIIEDLKKSYFQQLGNFNNIELLLSDLDFVFNEIKKKNNLLIEIDHFDSIIEFKNGIFFLEKEKFLNFSDIFFSRGNNLNTKFYVDSIYSTLNLNKFLLSQFKNVL